MSSCLYIRRRTKKGQTYYYCIFKRSVIDINSCRGCVNKEYKKAAKMTVKTRIKPVSKKRVTVSKKTYKEVYERCNGLCAICGTNQSLHLHHIEGRGKDKTDDPNNCIMLCNHCHLEVVHKNNKYWKVKLKELV